ncbi:ribonuclease H, partial [Trifolium pratense]
MVRTFYTNLYKEDQPIRDSIISWSTYPVNLEAEHLRLSAPISFVDCKKALFDMGPHKAPGEDGYPAIFFQYCWDIVGESLYKYVNQVWSNPSLISYINNTMLVLIPKVDRPEFVSQFRPIALCNVTYKIITKVIVNRIKPLLDGIISPYQSSFIPGRTIHHNIIVAQEMVHSMAKMKDQVEASYWKPMRAGRSGPHISHLLFADDLLLFAEASIEQAHCVMHCLDQFCQASGQKINNEKTQVYFSKNVDQHTKDDILQHTGFTHVNSLGKYLGANIAPGRTRGKFQHIIGKLQNKLSGWKHQCLSLAGRLTLTKSVLSSIPYYHMQYAKIPKTMCDEMEKIQRGFLWGDTEQKRKPHLINWDVCCLAKKDGGLGIRNPHQMNI